MRVIRLLAAASFACALAVSPAFAQKKPAPPKPRISEQTKEKAAQTNANPDAVVLQDFQKRVAAYMDVHNAAKKKALPLKQTDNPGEIKAAQESLAASIRAARPDAMPGDILTPEIRNKFQRLMYPEVQGTTGRKTKAQLREDIHEKDESIPKPVSLKVNATYPEGNPLPTTPANVLQNLPKLPPELEYRILDKNLIIRDVGANIIVDYITGAIQ